MIRMRDCMRKNVLAEVNEGSRCAMCVRERITRKNGEGRGWGKGGLCYVAIKGVVHTKSLINS